MSLWNQPLLDRPMAKVYSALAISYSVPKSSIFKTG